MSRQSFFAEVIADEEKKIKLSFSLDEEEAQLFEAFIAYGEEKTGKRLDRQKLLRKLVIDKIKNDREFQKHARNKPTSVPHP